jgi:tight adherence protein C
LTDRLWPRLAEAGNRLPDWLPVLRLRGTVEAGSIGLDERGLNQVKRAVGVGIAAASVCLLPLTIWSVCAAPIYLAATLLPDVAAAAAAEKTRRAIDDELPRLAELMAVLSAAGLNPALALPRAASDCAGPLRAALDTAIREIGLGAPRRRALREAAGRTPSRDFARFADLLADADRFGLPLGEAMRGLAAELRAKRAARIREDAQKLPVKMLFPLVFMILPAFILLTAGPMILTMTK